MGDPVRVLCVCTHNRTRSVMMAALLEHRLAALRCAATVRSAGFRAAGEPPTDQTVRILAERGIDVSQHRSHTVDAAEAATFDLVVTAEAAHVVELAGSRPALFARSFTLPELVARAEAIGARNGRPVATWLAEVGRDRPGALDYLDAVDAGTVGDVADPTGRSPRDWSTTVTTIDELVGSLARVLV